MDMLSIGVGVLVGFALLIALVVGIVVYAVRGLPLPESPDEEEGRVRLSD